MLTDNVLQKLKIVKLQQEFVKSDLLLAQMEVVLKKKNIVLLLMDVNHHILKDVLITHVLKKIKTVQLLDVQHGNQLNV